MSISASMQIGMNGLNIFRSATAVISQNISNVSTPGYSRQKAIIESAPTTNLSGFTLGSGAMISRIERFHDALLQQQMINSETTLGYDTAKSLALQQIEPAFNDIGVDGVGAALAHFFASWQDLTNNPGGTAERQSVLSNAQLLADELHSTSKTLTDMVSLQNASLTPVIDGINIKLKAIAKLNGQVTATEMVSGNANEVKDKRDLLLRELAKQIGITTTENGDGTTDVKLIGGGEKLVTGADAGIFSLDKTTDPTSFKVELIPAKGTLTEKTQPTLSTGSLGATLDLRDTIIPEYLTELNLLATTLTTKLNDQHKLGYDLSTPIALGIELFDPATTSAATFRINSLMNSTFLIAASSQNSAAGDNLNAVAIADLHNQRTMTGGTLSFNGYWDALVGKMGLDVNSSKTNVAQDEAFNNQLNILKDTNSGVSLDQELSDMMMYQRSYQACAQVISTATAMMDTLLGIVR